MSQVMGMLPGFVVGCIVVLAAWGINALITGALQRKKNEQKDGIISSIERMWIEAENLISSYQANRITENAFKHGLAGKIEAINRLYKTSLHQLDIFFVKYNEKLLEEYRQLLTGGAPLDRSAAEQPIDQPMPQEVPAADDSFSLSEAGEEASVATAMEPSTPEAGFEITFQEEAAASQEEETGAETTRKAAAVEEEPLVSAMSGAESEGEPVVPIDTFFDMEQDTAIPEEPGLYDQSDTEGGAILTEEQEQPIPIAYETPVETPVETPTKTPVETPEETQPQEMYGSAASMQEEAVSEEGQFEISPSAYPAMEDQTEAPQYAEETMIDQPAFDYSAESATASEATEAIEQPIPVPPPPPPVAPPSHERKSGRKRDETVEPATIYDIEAEAETIIADRTEILGTKKPANEEPPKSTLGITGDDISDQLDTFFKIKS